MRTTQGRCTVLVLAVSTSPPLMACSNGLDPNSPAGRALNAGDDPAAVARLAEAAPAPQAQILQDGQVSDAEYEQAVTADRDCVIAAGYEPAELVRDNGQLGFTVTASYEGQADPEAADRTFPATVDRCREEHSTSVGTVWVAQHQAARTQESAEAHARGHPAVCV